MDENQIKLFGSKKTDNWATPKWLYEDLDREFHFNFDPCPLNPTEDGLLVDWYGNVFCNPPYSKVKEFLQKAHLELKAGRVNTVVFLVFVNTDTAWFHDYVYHKADEIRFLRGRVKFVGASDNGAMRPSMVVVFKKKS